MRVCPEYSLYFAVLRIKYIWICLMECYSFCFSCIRSYSFTEGKSVFQSDAGYIEENKTINIRLESMFMIYWTINLRVTKTLSLRSCAIMCYSTYYYRRSKSPILSPWNLYSGSTTTNTGWFPMSTVCQLLQSAPWYIWKKITEIQGVQISVDYRYFMNKDEWP